MSRYELGLCQKFNQEIHGFTENTSSPEVVEHYICLYTFPYSNTLRDYVAFAKCYGATVEIVEIIWLFPGNEMVAIYKTFWLRIFQRLCRRRLIRRRFSHSTRIYSYLLNREYQSFSISL
jgi:hypothetical protein